MIGNVARFMVRLKKMDNAGLTIRDVLILWAVKEEPGLMGRELAHKLGYKHRSNVQICILRLIRLGYIEDRREKINNLTPNDLYLLPLGETFFNDLMQE